MVLHMKNAKIFLFILGVQEYLVSLLATIFIFNEKIYLSGCWYRNSIYCKARLF